MYLSISALVSLIVVESMTRNFRDRDHLEYSDVRIKYKAGQNYQRVRGSASRVSETGSILIVRYRIGNRTRTKENGTASAANLPNGTL